MRTVAALLLTGAVALSAPSDPARALALRLEHVRIDCKFERLPLDDFVRYCRTAAGINIVVKKPTIAKEMDPEGVLITLDVKDVTLLDVLTLALPPYGLAFKIDRNVLLITTKRDARGKPVLVLYDVAEILMPIRDFPAPDINLYLSHEEKPELPEPEVHVAATSAEELAELVRQFTGEGTWEDEGVRVTAYRRHLLIRQYPAVHREIALFLNEVRALR